MNLKISYLFILYLFFRHFSIAQNVDDEKKIEYIREKLENIYEENLKLRNLVTSYKRKNDSIKSDSIVPIIAEFDHTSLSYVLSVIEEYGWLGINKIGSTANNTLFLTIQHSNLETMEKYFPLLKKSVEQGNSFKINVATMEDRILRLKNLPQKYGTQKYFNKDYKRATQLVDNLKLVEKRRRKLKMGTLKKEAKIYGYVYPPTELYLKK